MTEEDGVVIKMRVSIKIEFKIPDHVASVDNYGSD